GRPISSSARSWRGDLAREGEGGRSPAEARRVDLRETEERAAARRPRKSAGATRHGERAAQDVLPEHARGTPEPRQDGRDRVAVGAEERGERTIDGCAGTGREIDRAGLVDVGARAEVCRQAGPVRIHGPDGRPTRCERDLVETAT